MISIRAYRFILVFLSLMLLIVPGARGVGAAGYAANFNSAYRAVEIPSIGSITGTFTVEMWVNLLAMPTPSVPAGFVGSRLPQNYGFDLKFDSSSQLHADIGNGTGWITITADAPASFQINVWSHIACVVTTNSYTLYQDGVQLVSSNFPPATPVLFDANHQLRFGSAYLSEITIGMIDEVRVWNVARTGAEIVANKNRALAGNEPGLMQYYRFDESPITFSRDYAPAGGFSHSQVNTFTGYYPSGITPFTPSGLAPVVDTLDVTSILGSASQLLLGTGNANGSNTSVWFEWGTTTNYGNATINGLTPAITYHFRAVGSNAVSITMGADKTFSIVPFVLVAETLDVTSVHASSSQLLLGKANAQGTNTSVWFEWGTTTNYGNVTPIQFAAAGSTNVDFNATITGLATATTYHFRAVASNAVVTAVGVDKTFLIPPFNPTVETMGGVLSTNSSLRLGGTGNPSGINMTGWFEWGTTTNYGNIAAGGNLGIGTETVDFGTIITNVNTNTTYHFRAVASNSLGMVLMGADKTFPIVPPLLAIDRETNVLLSWQITAPAFLLEQSTNLSTTNWTTLYGATVSNGFYQVAIPTDNGAFYRLRQLTNGPITAIITYTNPLDPEIHGQVPICPILDDGENYGCVVPNAFYAGYTYKVYATGIVDPNRRPNDPAPTFHWEIFFPEEEGSAKYTCAGISGYFAPILTILPNSLPDLVGPLIWPSNEWRFRLTVTHHSTDPLSTGTETTVIGFRVGYAQSALSLTQSAACQNPAVPPSDCLIPNGRPTTEPN
jgi:hypothetical protein